MLARRNQQITVLAISLALLVISLCGMASAAVLPPEAAVLNPVTEGLRTPLKVAIDPAGGFYLSDPRSGGVLKYDSYGRLARVIKTAQVPQGVALTLNGNLVVSQEDSAIIVTSNGDLVGKLGQGAGQFKRANGVAVDAAGYIYVVDSLDNCVQVFTATGAYSTRFGAKGTAAGQFNSPTGIAYEKNSNQIAVADTLNGRVEFFNVSANYSFVKQIGTYGANPLQFTSPQGIAFEYSKDAVPQLKRMYVVDSYQSAVQVVDPTGTGTYLSYIGSYGSANGQFMVPSDVAFDPATSRILVVNGYGNLTIFGIDGGVSPVPADVPTTLSLLPVPSQTTSADFALSGTVDAGATVVVASAATGSTAPASVSGTSWSYTTTLVPGLNTFAVSAVKGSNPPATQTVSITYVIPAPSLSMVPTSSFTNGSSIALSGTVDAGASVAVTNSLTGGTVSATINGTDWTAAVPLIAGVNSLTVAAKKAGSAAAELNQTVVCDLAVPQLTVSALASGSYTSTQVQNITGTANDAYLAQVTVNSQPATVVNSTFSAAVTLVPGANVITVVAVDQAGNAVADSRTIYFDSTRPEVTVAAPADNAYTAVSSVTISGSVDKQSSVVVGGVPAAMNGLEWSATVVLAAGINTIDVVATDLAGNSTAVKRTITLDASSPEIAIVSPAQDISTASASITVTGTANDTTPVTVSAVVNGVTLPVVATDGSFSTTIPLVADGTYAITVTAKDAAGNGSSITRTVVRDTAPPALTLNPVNTTVPETLSGTVEPGATVTVADKNGSVGTITAANGTWSATLMIGSYDPDSIAVRATDSAGNSTVKSLVITVPDGDLDGDGRVTITDALTAIRIYVQAIKPTAYHLAHGDIAPLMTGRPAPDGRIDLADAILILRKAVGQQSW